MEVERFKHRQLAPTVGPIVPITGKFEGPQDQSARRGWQKQLTQVTIRRFDNMHFVIQSTNSARTRDVSSVCSNNSPSRFRVKSRLAITAILIGVVPDYQGKSANTVHVKARLAALSPTRNHY
jgi:hypothetical protein